MHTNLSKGLMPVIVVLFLSVLACVEQPPTESAPPFESHEPINTSSGPPRGYHLGFTPFPYEISQAAVERVYQTLATDADIIAHHFDDGVPWPEALTGAEYPRELLEEWNTRLNNTPPNHKLYVAITPINIWRNDLAPYRGKEGDMPLPAPWDTYTFNHPDVKTAFLNHAINVIEFFKPDYLTIGIETNLLLTESADKWDAYQELHQFAYTELKARYPDLPLMVSLFGNALLEGYRQEDNHALQMQAFNQIIPYSDYFAISHYPYISKYMTNTIPETMFDELFSLSDKPIAITETGYPAETFSIQNGNLIFESTLEKQQDYIRMLLSAADQRDVRFIINFVLRDYDRIWEILPEADKDLGAIWRDTGLYDENGVPRPALKDWLNALARPHED